MPHKGRKGWLWPVCARASGEGGLGGDKTARTKLLRGSARSMGRVEGGHWMEARPKTAAETLKWPELPMVGKEAVHIANSTKGHPLDRTRANGASQVGQDG